jgi:ComF family protein
MARQAPVKVARSLLTLAEAVNLKWRDRVDGWRQHLEFAVLPAHCLLCDGRGSEKRDLCAPCAGDMAANRPCCPRCALPLVRDEPLCGVCLRRPPPFSVAWAPLLYQHPLDQLVTRFKFGRSLAAGRVLGELLVEAGQSRPPAIPQLLLPIPLHASRLRERGYNQALELARPLACALGVALDHDLLRRSRQTDAQTGLDAVQRRRNVKNAFVLSGRATLPAHIALFDDVMTTGATLREAARTLLRAGVARVDVWALARAPAARG